MHTINLSSSEWRLMNALWQSSPRTITQLVGQLKDETGWTKHTIITMLNRLEAKGAVAHSAGQRAKQFYPLIDQKEAQVEETQNLLARLYNGSLGLMLNTLTQQNELSQTDIDELYAILKQAEKRLK